MAMSAEELQTLIGQINADSKYRDSITISTPGKGGEIKVYINSDDPVDSERRILNMIRSRKVAGDAVAAQDAKP